MSRAPWRRAPADVVLDDEVPRVEVALRSDPHVVPDDARPVEAPLQVRLCADEDAVANLEGLEMFEPDALPDLQARADPPRDRAPDDRPHRRIHDVAAMHVAGVLFDDPVVIELRLHPLCECVEERGIGRRSLAAMHRRNEAWYR